MPGPGVERDQPLGRPFGNEGHVRDAADIDEGGRQGQARAQGQGAVIDRHQRRALAATVHVRGAEIVDDGNAERRAQAPAIAELHRKLLLRPVQHGLAMKADHIDAGKLDAIRLRKGLDAIRMLGRDHALRERQHAAARIPGRQPAPGNHRFPQQMPLGRAIGIRASRPERMDSLPIRFDQRNIDAVHRSPAHKPDRLH